MFMPFSRFIVSSNRTSVRRQHQPAQDCAQSPGCKDEPESARLQPQRCAQGRGHITNRLRIEPIDEHGRSTKQKHSDLEAPDLLPIDQLRNVHQRRGGGRPRFLDHTLLPEGAAILGTEYTVDATRPKARWIHPVSLSVQRLLPGIFHNVEAPANTVGRVD